MIRVRLLSLIIASTLLSSLALASGVRAEQSLIPTPYPSAVGGGQPLNPEPSVHGAPQEIMRDPYPQITGSDSQGNPPIARTHRLQRRVPTINERKYRVDRH